MQIPCFRSCGKPFNGNESDPHSSGLDGSTRVKVHCSSSLGLNYRRGRLVRIIRFVAASDADFVAEQLKSCTATTCIRQIAYVS